jgi:hypothetical protein
MAKVLKPSDSEDPFSFVDLMREGELVTEA